MNENQKQQPDLDAIPPLEDTPQLAPPIVMSVEEGEGLEYRLRPSTFNLFHEVIERAINSPGEVININPSPLRASTYAARLRDAIASKKRYDWPASFTRTDLERADLVIRQNGLSVQLGPRALRKGVSSEPGVGSVYNPRVAGLPVDRDLTNEEVKAFCILLSAKLIPGPIILEASAQTQLAALEPQYDISFSLVDNGKVLLF